MNIFTKLFNRGDTAELSLENGDTMSVNVEYTSDGYGIVDLPNVVVSEVTLPVVDLYHDPYDVVTGTSYGLGDSGSFYRKKAEILSPMRFQEQVRCEYCNRKNHYANGVCDGCGGTL